eukprot:XP_001702938.1 predicted protein [Chlamydomonas reinhardtii]
MPYQCQPSSANGGSSTCNQKNYDYYDSTIATGSHFRKGCKLTSSHHDFRIIEAIPEEQRKTTLLIVNLRDPASRAVSHYHMLKRHGDPGALNASGVVEYFTTDPLGVSISRNRMTRVMAGEFCCKDGAPARYTGAAMYKLALERLDEFCVVGLTSRVQDTMLYVLHALGLPTDKPPKNLHYHNNAKKYQPTAPEVLKQLSDFNAHDVDLYTAARTRFAEQMSALGEAGSGNSEGGDGVKGEGVSEGSGKTEVIDTAR